MASRGTCKVDPCGGTDLRGEGLCGKHYMRWKKHGDTTTVLASVPPRPPSGEASPQWLEVPTYQAVRQRLERIRGKASQFECDCGNPAREWAYTHDADEELEEMVQGRRVLKFSADLNHYVPKCTPCHRRFDNEIRG